MPDTTTQQFDNHTRWQPPFHFFLAPVLLLHFFWSLWRLIQEPGADRAEGLLLAAALVVMGGLTRVNALKAQDRVILLEERLRYARVLPADLQSQSAALQPAQVVALRFASDAELPDRIRETLAGRHTKLRDIKKAVVAWRADLYRV